MEKEIFAEEIINKKELKEELTHIIYFLYHVDAKNPVEVNSFFDMIINSVQKNKIRLVKALIKELCSEKNMDYEEYILNTIFRKISKKEEFKEIDDLMKKL